MKGGTNVADFAHAPIIQCSYQLLADLHRLTARMTKQLRFTTGVEVAKLAGNTLDELVAANCQRQGNLRLEAIDRATTHITCLRLRLRLLHELKAVSSGQLAVFNSQIENISKQLTAWRKWTQAQTATTPSDRSWTTPKPQKSKVDHSSRPLIR